LFIAQVQLQTALFLQDLLIPTIIVRCHITAAMQLLIAHPLPPPYMDSFFSGYLKKYIYIDNCINIIPSNLFLLLGAERRSDLRLHHSRMVFGATLYFLAAASLLTFSANAMASNLMSILYDLRVCTGGAGIALLVLQLGASSILLGLHSSQLCDQL
jgi:hypothetical protein